MASIAFEEYKNKLNNLRPALDDLGGALHLDEARNEVEKLEEESAQDGFWNDTENSQRVQKRIKTLQHKLDRYAKLSGAWEDMLTMCEMAIEEDDDSMLPDLESEFHSFEETLESMRLETLLTGEYDANNAILTFHAGAGGTEAQDWTSMLYRMYNMWAERHGYTVKLMDYLDGDEAGIKSATIMIEGENAYGFLKSENGIHRLVRISPFDASGRRHTSFAAVEVMPEITEDSEIELRDEDIKMVDRLTGKPLHLDISDLPMKRGITTNRNKFVLGPSGSGKSFFMNHLVRQYYEQGAHVVLVDTGNSYQGLCEMIRRKTGGTDGVYFTYTEEKPISFNPFYTDDYVFDVEKKDSIKTLLLTLWKSEDDKVTKTESGELGSAVSAYIERIRADRSIVPSFNTFYEYMRDDYRRELAERDIKVEKEDFNIDNMLTTMRQYYRGGRYDFLLNSAENIDLLGKRFIVFEIDSIKDNRELFPVVTIIIMEAFINKMRRLKGVRKQLIVEEAWKALSSANMADYLRYMYKTVRKYFGEAIVVTQEVDDIISSPVVKESIINNSDCKILLDQRKYMNKFDQIQALLGLTEKEKSQILSINMANNPSRLYKEVWIGLGGTQSAVYATEVSAEEYLAYTTEETEKVEVYRLAEQLGGDIEAAIRQLAERRRNKK